MPLINTLLSKVIEMRVSFVYGIEREDVSKWHLTENIIFEKMTFCGDDIFRPL